MSNLKLGSGIAPIAEFLAAGVLVTLGTDGAISGNDLDMWMTMRLAATLPKGRAMQPDIVSAEQTLHMATLNGAKAIGRQESLGSLEVGKDADFIILAIDNVHATPMFDPINHLIYSAAKSDVSDVFIAGKHIVRNRQITTVDMPAVLNRVASLTPLTLASLGRKA